MTLHTFQNGERFLANSLGALQSYGITLEIGTDFTAYRDMVAEERPHQPLGAPFDATLRPLDETNAYWIIGRDADGEMVHTQAMRLLDTKGQTIAEHLRQNFREFPPAGIDLDLGRSRYRPGPNAQRMRGRICYHGDFWLGGPKGKFRGTEVSGILGRYGFWEALNRLDADFVFGLMAYTVACKGFAARHGYIHAEPGAVNWFRPDSDASLEGFMVYVHSDDIRFLADMPLLDVVTQAA